MIALLLAAATLPPVQLQRTETERAGSPPFDLVGSSVTPEQIRNCRVEETLPMGSGTAETRSCGPMMPQDAAEKRCKEAARHDSLPQGVTGKSCLDDYLHGKFLFLGELKQLVIARGRDGAPVAVFRVLEGDVLDTFQPVAGAVLVGVGGGERVHYAVVSTRGILRAPQLGDEAYEVGVAHGHIRVTGRARAMQVDLVPKDGALVVVH